MRELIAEVLELQRHWTAQNTPEMQRRGQLIRHEIPDWFGSIDYRLKRALGPAGDDLLIEGRDGTGPKAEVPWVRFSSRSHSPNARTGWYVVLLIHAQARGFYFWLGHGSTRLENNSFVARDQSEIQALLLWARGILGDRLNDLRLSPTIDLGSARDLADAYEKSALTGYWYDADALPEDEHLARDCEHLSSLLRVLYDSQDMGRMPFSPAQDVEQALHAATSLSSGRGIKGQGFGLTPQERIAVERRAMSVVQQALEADGYSVEDVSASKPVDFVATRDGSSLFVEVKGTTGHYGAILLTANEVEFHRATFPNNALMVVHTIDLVRDRKKPIATGGVLVSLSPWQLDDDRLRAISYQYLP